MAKFQKWREEEEKKEQLEKGGESKEESGSG